MIAEVRWKNDFYHFFVVLAALVGLLFLSSLVCCVCLCCLPAVCLWWFVGCLSLVCLLLVCCVSVVCLVFVCSLSVVSLLSVCCIMFQMYYAWNVLCLRCIIFRWYDVSNVWCFKCIMCQMYYESNVLWTSGGTMSAGNMWKSLVSHFSLLNSMSCKFVRSGHRISRRTVSMIAQARLKNDNYHWFGCAALVSLKDGSRKNVKMVCVTIAARSTRCLVSFFVSRARFRNELNEWCLRLVRKMIDIIKTQNGRFEANNKRILIRSNDF